MLSLHHDPELVATRLRRVLCIALWVTWFVTWLGCASRPLQQYRTRDVEGTGDTATARKLNDRAVDVMQIGPDGCWLNLDKAEGLLCKSLSADSTYGPAHNNLGKIYYLQQKYYLAAWEFEYAMNLMPMRTEPMYNLATVFEEVGKLDQAIELYGLAHAAEPKNACIIGNFVRAQLKAGTPMESLQPLLEELVFLDTRPDWAHWARHQLVKIESRGVEATPVEYPEYNDTNSVELFPFVNEAEELPLPSTPRRTEPEPGLETPPASPPPPDYGSTQRSSRVERFPPVVFGSPLMTVTD